MTVLNIRLEPVGTDRNNITWIATIVDDAGVQSHGYQGSGNTRDAAVQALHGLYLYEQQTLAKQAIADDFQTQLQAKIVTQQVNW